MLAPLLLGTGMMFRTIRSNASLIFPRVGLLVVLLWVLWFVNSVVQNTVMYLRRQGAIDHRCVLALAPAVALAVRWHLPFGEHLSPDRACLASGHISLSRPSLHTIRGWRCNSRSERSSSSCTG